MALLVQRLQQFFWIGQILPVGRVAWGRVCNQRGPSSYLYCCYCYLPPHTPAEYSSYWHCDPSTLLLSKNSHLFWEQGKGWARAGYWILETVGFLCFSHYTGKCPAIKLYCNVSLHNSFKYLILHCSNLGYNIFLKMKSYLNIVYVIITFFELFNWFLDTNLKYY